ncbi:MFS transporter [Hyphomonas sp.]|jgi:predicted MFS family arabinose efflux permease|uniref:MFS transporter n=1 Tax=Hyphomonas sp. TaxID=87 RepID=UPI003002D5C8
MQSGHTSYRWYVLFILTAIFTTHYIDRAVISVLIEPIKKEFGLSDSALGLLSGLAHSGALAVVALPIGRLTDSTNRVRLIAIVVTVWSGLTALGALSTGFVSLLLMRIGVGAAEAGGPPASVSIIGDLFDREELPKAMGIYYLAMGLGTGLIFLVGGFVAQYYGWRAVFLIAGIPGFVFALLVLTTIREPARRAANNSKSAKPSFGKAIREMSRNRALLYIVISGTCASLAHASLITWLGPFLIRVREFSLGETGIIMAVATIGGNTLGSVVAGFATPALARGSITGTYRFPALLLCLSLPVCWLMATVPGQPATIVLVIMLSVILGGWSGQVTAVVLASSPTSMHGTVSSSYWMLANLVGVGVGPVAIGLISDMAGSLGVAMTIGASINLFAALFFFIACQNLKAGSAEA